MDLKSIIQLFNGTSLIINVNMLFDCKFTNISQVCIYLMGIDVSRLPAPFKVLNLIKWIYLKSLADPPLL